MIKLSDKLQQFASTQLPNKNGAHAKPHSKAPRTRNGRNQSQSPSSGIFQVSTQHKSPKDINIQGNAIFNN